MIKRLLKAALALSVLLLAVLLCGCERASVELSEMMIIQGLGIDYENGEVIATAEMLNNLGSSAAGVDDIPENKARIFSASGKTISEAVNKIAIKCGNEPLYAHTRVVVLGENAADKNLADVLDFFERDYNTKPAMLICVARDCTARELFSASVDENGVKSEIIEDILKTGNELSLAPRVRIAEAVCFTKESTASLALPAVSLVFSDDTAEYSLSGCAVFNSDNTFCDYIDKSTSFALLFLENKVNKGSFTVSLSENAEASMLIVNSKTKYSVSINDNTPVFTLKIKLLADLNEFSRGAFDKLEAEAIKSIERQAGRALEKRVESCIFILRDELFCDAARFSKMLSLKRPKYYGALSESERESIYKLYEFEVKAEVVIRRTGDEGFDLSDY